MSEVVETIAPLPPKDSTPPSMYYSSNTSPLSFSASEDIEIENTNKSPTQDAWLPITESRNGNAYYAAFHILCSGIGIQALLLPVAFIDFGW
jgi:hypothetical protein